MNSTPNLLRVGVTGKLELRAETDGYARLRTSDGYTDDGFADLALGVKWHALDGSESGPMPSVACLVHADLDSGSEAFRGHAVRPSLRVVGEWEFDGGVAAGVMPGVIYDTDENKSRFLGAIMAATVSKSWTENFRTFAEVSGQQIAKAEHGGSVVTGDFGAALIIRGAMQLDAAGSVGLNKQSPDSSWTVGFSVKY
jgi:hypothetical protein